MASEFPIRRVAWFCAKVFILTPVCLVLWWEIVPYYVWVLGHVCAATLKLVFGYPISDVLVHPAGRLHSATTLGFALGGRQPSIPIVQLISNLAIFIALMLATSGLGAKRLLKRTAVGVGILAFTHWLFIIVFFVWSAAIVRNQTVSIAAGQILVILPFVLWVALAFFAHLSGAPSAAADASKTDSTRADKSAQA